MNVSQTFTAWSNNPPGLFLKSSTRPIKGLSPCSKVSRALSNSAPVFSWNWLSLMYPIVFSSSNLYLTLFMRIISLVKAKSFGSVKPFLMIERVTFSPAGPLILFTASSKVIFSVNSSSIFIILSPDFNPALKPGVSSMGDTIVKIPSLIVISMPMPPKLPFVSTCNSLYRSGRIKDEWGSSVRSIPFIAP